MVMARVSAAYSGLTAKPPSARKRFTCGRLSDMRKPAAKAKASSSTAAPAQPRMARAASASAITAQNGLSP